MAALSQLAVVEQVWWLDAVIAALPVLYEAFSAEIVPNRWRPIAHE